MKNTAKAWELGYSTHVPMVALHRCQCWEYIFSQCCLEWCWDSAFSGWGWTQTPGKNVNKSIPAQWEKDKRRYQVLEKLNTYCYSFWTITVAQFCAVEQYAVRELFTFWSWGAWEWGYINFTTWVSYWHHYMHNRGCVPASALALLQVAAPFDDHPAP